MHYPVHYCMPSHSHGWGGPVGWSLCPAPRTISYALSLTRERTCFSFVSTEYVSISLCYKGEKLYWIIINQELLARTWLLYVLFFFFFWYFEGLVQSRLVLNMPCNQSWSQTPDLSALTILLGLQACANTSSQLSFNFKTELFFSDFFV